MAIYAIEENVIAYKKMFNFSFRNVLTDEQRTRRNYQSSISGMTDTQRLYINHRRTVAGMTDDERLTTNHRRTVSGMTDEQRLTRNHRQTIASMTDQQRFTTNYLHTISGMTEEQRLITNERHSNNYTNELRDNSRTFFKKIPQFWNYCNPCEHCQCVHLISASASQKKKCCKNGNFLINPKYPKLFELPQYIKNLIINRTEHFSFRSSYYNNIFSIAVTGYDNGKEGVGSEHVNGPSSLKINGRAFHFFPTSSKQKYGGIANFTYDGSFQAENHANLINSNQTDKRVNKTFVKGFKSCYLCKI